MTKQDLKDFYWFLKNIEKLEQRIEELHAVATKQTSRMKSEADAIHGTGYSDRQGDVMAELADLRRELDTQLQKSYEQQLQIERAISDLTEREKYLIRARYMELKTWESIAVEMDLSWRQTHYIHSGALKKLGGRCYG
jgi:DNA-directed RNA polymerase specialized sigma subunit